MKRIKRFGNIRNKIESRRLFEKELQEECDKMNNEIGIPNYYKVYDILVIQRVGYKPLRECSETLKYMYSDVVKASNKLHNL